jgi:hypothetical protein
MYSPFHVITELDCILDGWTENDLESNPYLRPGMARGMSSSCDGKFHTCGVNIRIWGWVRRWRACGTLWNDIELNRVNSSGSLTAAHIRTDGAQTWAFNLRLGLAHPSFITVDKGAQSGYLVVIKLAWHDHNTVHCFFGLASSCPSARMELGYHWTEFHKTWYVEYFSKICRENSR